MLKLKGYWDGVVLMLALVRCEGGGEWEGERGMAGHSEGFPDFQGG